MAGANPQRTSWTPEEVRGELEPEWYRPLEPYISPKVQIIAANDLLYVSTARGLYTLNATDGSLAWVYPTELPLGHSPTVDNGVVYVGGFDHRLHAIDALTGQGLWTFEGGAGFNANPLVVEGLVYAGNRDGYMYAIFADDQPQRGTLAWRFETDGPILFSAAYANGKIYFASNDAHAYALDAQSGQLVWKSAKLPTGDGFHSWWPVIVENRLILPGSRGYRVLTPPQIDWSRQSYAVGDVGLYSDSEPNGAPLGDILPDGSMDASRALEYLEEKPWRRVYYVLDLDTGQEITYDFDQDGQDEFAPLLNTGTHTGTRYPPAIGPDGRIYTFNHYTKRYGHISGWTLGDSSITIPSSRVLAIDEPTAYSAGGNVIYWNHCCDRSAGAFDVAGGQDWSYFSYDLDSLIPGYGIMYMGTFEANSGRVYGGWNGIYGIVGDQNPPVPYKGRVYMHRSNAIIAWSPQGGAQALPLVETVEPPTVSVPAPTDSLEQKLSTEIQKIIDAGHLRPGYGVQGHISLHGKSRIGDNLTDYWHNPLDTIYVLTQALPHLPQDLQRELRAYIQQEFADYPPYEYTHVGWSEGAAREAFDLPPEVQADLVNRPATMWSTYDFRGWTGPDWKWTPHTFYALWKYAQVFGNAREIFDQSKRRLWPPPSDSILAEYPFAHNAYIAGHLGYLELEKLAGYPESSDVRAELDRLLDLRVSTFAKDNPWGPDSGDYAQSLSVARNFMFLTPELGQYLHDHALVQVESAVAEYEQVAPYWFVTKYEATYREGVMQHLWDYNALFAAKALILGAPRQELGKYLDVPAFARGDLFYIQNLVLAIEAAQLTKTVSPSRGFQGDSITYTLFFSGSGESLTLADTLPDGVSAPGNFELVGTSVRPTYDSDQHRLTWSDTPPPGQEVIIRFSVTISTGERRQIVNTAQLAAAGSEPKTASAVVIANPLRIVLPLVIKE